MGPDRGLQHDDRRRSVGRCPTAAHLRNTGARTGSRLGARRPQRCGTLHQDDSQRHRIRSDAGVRRGLFDHAAQVRIRARPASGGRDLAPRQRGAIVAAGPDGERLAEQPASRGHRAACRGFWRRAMGGRGSDRSERAGAGDHSRAAGTHRIARSGFVRGKNAGGDAQSVRRARDQEQ